MRIDPITHEVWHEYVFQGLTLGDNTRTEAIAVDVSGYRHGISLNAFLHGLKRKYRKTGDDRADLIRKSRVENHRTYDPHRNILWIGKTVYDYKIEQDMDVTHTARYAESNPDIAEYFRTLHPEPTLRFSDLYEFYQHIRYDRKTRWFMPLTPT